MAGRQMKRFSDEQVERAKRVDVVDYARSQGLELIRNGSWYRAKHKGGLYFHREGNTWHWATRGVGGTGAISLCMELEEKTFVEAVKTLLGEEMDVIRHTPDWVPAPEPEKEFVLPQKNASYKHMYAYLTKSRGIDVEIIKDMVKKGLLYENTQKSCVFVGKDKDGIARHASVRSTNTTGKVFKQDVPGSKKQFSFSISGTSKTLNVCEAPIDVLSYMTFQKIHGMAREDSYLALGGVADKALERFLDEHKDIEKIRVCTDNDPYLNTIWEEENLKEKVMNIEKGNKVKETDDSIIFRTYSDYSKFIAKNAEASVKYVEFPKEQLTLADEDTYTVDIAGEQEYTLYESMNNYGKGIGEKVSGRDLYNEHFFKLPAGERAAYSIHEKYGKEYKVTRHRPVHKDFNEDLVLHRQLNTKMLEQAGISKRLIDWYKAEPDAFTFKDGVLQIEGKEHLVVCDNPLEMFAFMHQEEQEYISKHGENQYEAFQHFIAYKSTDQVVDYVKEHPDINVVWVATRRTPEAAAVTEQIKKSLADNPLIGVGRLTPRLDRYSEDVREMNRLAEALEQVPMEELQQIEAAAGLEI
ncbi:MAG: DUF3991 and toprim domain-containing protein [Bacteroidales bacterium]|nr:DUF3991 and toprim domain-containing protein [Clostridium sp.]MCM1204961.1 DUF3991 and toprim domain-containing protein [Bacteroidales bacterium]